MAERFSTKNAAMKWLETHFGMYWEENGEDGQKWGACVPPKKTDGNPIFAYAETIPETVSKLAEEFDAS